MRKFLLITALASGGFAFAGPITTEDPQGLASGGHFDDQGDEVDVETNGLIAVELAADQEVAPPREDHGDKVTVVGLSEVTVSENLDFAGIQRTAAGRPVDAPPGSMDAALTGMQHDAGGMTVRNTVSPEPTPSPVAREIFGEHPEIREEGAPQAQEPLEAEHDNAG